MSLLVLVRRSRGSRAAGGRRVSDRVATLDAGEDGGTMGDADDVTGWSWRSPLLPGQWVPRDGGCAAGAQTYLGARTRAASGHRRIDGVPCWQVRGAAARSIEGRPAFGWRAVPVWELAAPAGGVLGGGLVRGHGHHRDGVLAGQLDPGLITQGAQPVVAATGQLAGHRQPCPAGAGPTGEPGVVGVVRAGRLVGVHGALIQRPAQRRRPLPGQRRAALVLAVGVVDGDVQPGVPDRVPGGGEPAGVAEFLPDRGGQQRAQAVLVGELPSLDLS